MPRKRPRQIPSRAVRRGAVILPSASAVLKLRSFYSRLFSGIASIIEKGLFDKLDEIQDGTVKADGYSPGPFVDDLEEIDVQIEEYIDNAKVGTVAERVGNWIQKKNAEDNKRLVGIDTRKILPENRLSDFQKENVSKIKSLSEYQIKKVDEILSRALREGVRVETIKKELRKELGLTRQKADLLARDQTLKFNAKITQDRQRAAGVNKYIWTTVGDERVRSEHADLDGTVQSWDNPPDVGHPGEDYQCRCQAFPYVEELDESTESEEETSEPQPAEQPEDDEGLLDNLSDNDISFSGTKENLTAAWQQNFGERITSPAEVKKLMAVSDEKATYDLEVHHNKSISVGVWGKGLQMSYTFSPGRVKVGAIFLDKTEAGRGRGSEILLRQAENFSKMGVKKIVLEAAEIGRYYWPSVGFEPDPDRVQVYRNLFDSYLTKRGLPTSSATTVKEIAEHPHGKAFLLSEDAPNLERLTSTSDRLQETLKEKLRKKPL